MPGLVNMQPSRFATILLYLNDDMKGGETSFPRWLNADTNAPLKVKPEKGKAILFYNLLPDGNYDERSQHAALPVTQGDKYLANLWIWDPIMDHTATEHF
jgi:prolyl 4-hydroxylase